ncbi:polyprenyl diphosphate synthase [Sediminicurvatus halobius]|uniref:Ditrans,polycis-undecaprenyl-diphosphate synthase ((2E,6E)-farnesyl-diphosphate specific) n=1 Tax=Sediminicurvatus halobius TaxID=2182432 RepID=A0A2U2N4L2_9GAMM|nr:polyprenyl diphosphate synthase [Spiribacter halobius]PWG63909.1 di-trans,poly-cis-decaprenylcistransferase [Spiribacter halobius]UEX76321.1 di-trans,poly-cis-decaprenylcistransferase [Spiribacter halobius]
MTVDKQGSQAGAPVPRHVAIIMDGNGRWARARNQPRHYGHRAGARAVREAVEACGRAGVEALTLFAFSSENWRRPATEVRVLMELFLRTLDRETDRLHENDIRLRMIGDRSRLEPRLRERIATAERLTRDNRGLHLNVAASYGGRWDIACAARALAREVAAGDRDPESIDETALGEQISLADLPAPDLFVRTGGERRISNFLLWQLAYTELYFTDVLWPDFDAAEMHRAMDWYASRQRRFGRVPDADSGAGHA